MKFPYGSSYDDLQALVNQIKSDIQLSTINFDPYSFVSPSAYDMAWLAMVEEDHNVDDDGELKPMFQDSLDWILCNQNAGEGYWGNSGCLVTSMSDAEDEDRDEMNTLTSTLACVLALHKWNIGCFHLHKGALTDFALLLPFKKIICKCKTRLTTYISHSSCMAYCVIHVRYN